MKRIEDPKNEAHESSRSAEVISGEEDKIRRAAARRNWLVRRSSLRSQESGALVPNASPEERVAMVEELSRNAWSLREMSSLACRSEWPIRVVHREAKRQRSGSAGP